MSTSQDSKSYVLMGESELRIPGDAKPRTEIQGGPGGPWPPQKFSVVAAVSLYSFISISDYQIGTPFSYVISFNFCLSFV